MAIRHDIPSFEPAPVRARRGGWSPERQRAFIAGLLETGSVGTTCKEVGISRESAYRLARRADAVGFRRAWDAALHAHRYGDAKPVPPGVPSWSLTGMMLALSAADTCANPRPRNPRTPPSPSAAKNRRDCEVREPRHHRLPPSPSPAQAQARSQLPQLRHDPAKASLSARRPPSSPPYDFEAFVRLARRTARPPENGGR